MLIFCHYVWAHIIPHTTKAETFIPFLKFLHPRSGTVAHTFNVSTSKTETGGFLWDPGSLVYIGSSRGTGRPCLKKKRLFKVSDFFISKSCLIFLNVFNLSWVSLLNLNDASNKYPSSLLIAACLLNVIMCVHMYIIHQGMCIKVKGQPVYHSSGVVQLVFWDRGAH